VTSTHHVDFIEAEVDFVTILVIEGDVCDPIVRVHHGLYVVLHVGVIAIVTIIIVGDWMKLLTARRE